MLTVVTLLLLTGLFEQLPEATLAAVVIAAVIELVDFPALARLYRIYAGRHAAGLAPPRAPDFLAAIAAMLGVLVFDTLPGLFIGIGVSLLLLLYRASRPHVAALGRVPRPRASGSTSRRHPEYARAGRRSRSCASRPASSSPTPTPCARASSSRGRRASGRWCWTPRPCRSST